MAKKWVERAAHSKTAIPTAARSSTYAKPSSEVDLTTLFDKLGPDPQDNINAIIHIASKLCGGALAYYCRFSEPEGITCACAGKFMPAIPDETKPLGGSLCRETFSNNGNQPIVVENLGSSPLKDADPAINQMGFTSFLGCPVKNHKKNIGELGLLDIRKGSYSGEEVTAVNILARVLALEESRLRKETELKRRIELEKMLKQVSAGAIELQDLQTFLEDSLEMIGKSLKLGATFIYEYRKAAGEIGVISEWYPLPKGAYKLDMTAIPADSIKWSLDQLMQGEIINITDINSMPECAEKEIARALGTVSFLLVPMFNQAEFIGVMGFADDNSGRIWSEEDVNILRTASEIFARTIENERLKDRQKEAIRKAIEELSDARAHLETEVKEHKRTIRHLKAMEKEVARKNARLKDMNNALSVMFSKRNDDIEQIEKQMVHNIRDLIDPALQRLKANGLRASQQKWLDVLEANLNDIASPLAAKLANGYQKLTPTEIKIASFIKHGNTNKEIARLLSISNRTVEVHRCNIRKKLGIRNRDMNLRTYLLSMQ